ncbi:MAG: hypothetical protein IJH34_17340 [Romboutsia sp.]|nr:hypothetical protein [Romboutsia sp.]
MEDWLDTFISNNNIKQEDAEKLSQYIDELVQDAYDSGYYDACIDEEYFVLSKVDAQAYAEGYDDGYYDACEGYDMIGV